MSGTLILLIQFLFKLYSAIIIRAGTERARGA